MQVSYEWLNEFVDLCGIEPEEIAYNLTMSGLEVEEIEYKKPSFANIITAKIIKIDNHPNADKLHLVTVDLGGIGKGYALTRIRELLEKNGVEKALVNFGNSSVLAVGSHPLGDYWPVGVDNPFTKEHMADLKLRDTSLSVSGNMPSHPRHIVNPLTGKFVEAKKMVSVVAKDPVVAEVLTTAFMVADEERIPIIASRFDIVEKQVYKL